MLTETGSPGTNPTLSAKHTSGVPALSPVPTTCLFLHIERCRRARPYRLSPGRQRLSSGRRPPPQTRWSQLGEASKFPGQRVTFTKPWRERRRSHPGRVRRPLGAAPRTGAFDLVREYAAHTAHRQCARLSGKGGQRCQISRAAASDPRRVGCIWRLAARTRSGVSVVFWPQIHAFADANGDGRCETDDDACWASELFPPRRDMATARLGVRSAGER